MFKNSKSAKMKGKKFIRPNTDKVTGGLGFDTLTGRRFHPWDSHKTDENLWGTPTREYLREASYMLHYSVWKLIQ